MAKNPRGKPFEQGNPGGPGRPLVPADIKEARTLNKLELERILNKYMGMPGPQLNEIMKSQTLPVFELIVAKILAKAFNEGDQKRLEFVLDRLIGKVKTEVDHDVRQTLTTTPEQERIVSRLLDMVQYKDGIPIIESKTDPDQKVIDEK